MNKTDILAGSHLPILIKVLQLSYGPVLEIGMGLNSTPVLHWLCKEAGRELLSLENDPKWLEPNKAFEEGLHRVEFVSDWDKAPIFLPDEDRRWSVVLIDHRPALRRRIEALRLKDRADYIILHDSEPEIDRFYRYSGIYKHFKYQYDFTIVGKPHTTVLSNFEDVRSLWIL